MAKYEARYRTSSESPHDVLLRTNDYAAAINACIHRMECSDYRGETNQARTALETRGYYVMGYGSREVYIEEVG